MIELQYRAGLAYPPPAVFCALTDVSRYPLWQSDVAAAVVRGGGPLRPGAEITQVRRSLGRRTCLSRTVDDYEQDRLLTLGTVTGTRPLLREEFQLSPGPVAGCCLVVYRLALDGVPVPAETLEAMLTHQMMSVLDGLRAHLVADSAAALAQAQRGGPAVERVSQHSAQRGGRNSTAQGQRREPVLRGPWQRPGTAVLARVGDQRPGLGCAAD